LDCSTLNDLIVLSEGEEDDKTFDTGLRDEIFSEELIE